MEGQTNDEELLRKELNQVTRLFRQLKSEGTKLDQTYVQQIAVMIKSNAQWGKTLSAEKGKTDRIIKQTEKMRENAAWMDKHTETMRRNRKESSDNILARQREHQQDVQTNIKMRNIQSKAGEQMAFFTSALKGGVGIGTIFEKLGGKVYQLSKRFELLDEVLQAKADMDQLKAEGKGDQQAYKDAEAKFQSGTKALGGVGETDKMQQGGIQNKFGKSMGAMGKFAKKHAMGMALGVGAGGLILSTIIKALSVAPMFQAMMKLFKFAVTMILMPIGTFFGAILRPIMIGLIKTIAPQFKGWMKTAMKLGDQVGKFIMDFFTDPAKYLIGAMGGIIPMIVSGLGLPDFNSWNPFDDGKTQEEKDTEHTEYWEGVDKSLEDAWLSIYTPLTEFGTLLWDFFSVTIPNTINTFADGIWQGFKKIGKILLTPFLMFIGTINTIFLWLLPDLFKGFWEWVETGFGDLQSALTDWLQPILDFFGFSDPSEDFKDADTSAGKVKSFAESIEDWWKDIFGHTEESEADSKDASNAMEGITKVFDSAATWINNALSEISTYRYIDDEGNPQPTDDAVTASGISPININARGRPSWISKTAANGFSGMVNSPTMFMAGEAGAEHVNISPHGNKSSGVPVVNINIARIDKNADFEQLKPAIQRWILEANSRRGMI